ncbi:MAG: DNA polymerase [Planctomycetota bacterium]
MINLHRRLVEENRPARMLLQIHDELLFETPADAAAEDGRIIAEEMVRAIELRVPLKVDVGVGPNWRDAK